MRELVGSVRADLLDIRAKGGFEALLAPDDYAPSQVFARQRRDGGADGIVYPSVRNPGGECIAAFWPDGVARPMHGRHFRYHWDGARIHRVRADGRRVGKEGFSVCRSRGWVGE